MSKNFKCESCGGEVRFSPKDGCLVCEYCGKKATREIGEKNENVVFKKPYSAGLTCELNDDKTKVYICNSCGGATIINKDVETVKRCISCGSTDISLQNVSSVHPDVVVPFKIEKDEAGKLFRSWIKSRKFAPNDLKKMAKLEKISGAYVPVYSFDCETDVSYSAVGIIEHKDKEGKVIRESEHFVRDSYTSSYNEFNCSGNSQFSESVVGGLGDFDLQERKPYSVDYLLGFMGVDAGIGVHDAYKTMEHWMQNEHYNSVRRNLNFKYDDVRRLNVKTVVHDAKVVFLYAPVWVNHYSYKNKNYHVYINGQTGKVTGKAPKSFWKILFTVLGVVAAAMGIAMLVKFLKG